LKKNSPKIEKIRRKSKSDSENGQKSEIMPEKLMKPQKNSAVLNNPHA